MNGKIRKILNIAGILLVVFCITCLFSPSCYAEENKGSIELQCSFSEEDEDIVFDGDEYAVTKIAGWDNGKFRILPQYKDFDCSWDMIISSEYHEKALQISEYVISKEKFDYSGKTHDGGRLVFKNIDTGLYLVVRTHTDAKNEGYLVDPFLVSVPQFVENEFIYNVVTEPKFSKIPDDESSDEEESSYPESSEPSRDISENSEAFSTGDNSRSFEAVFYMLTGIFSAAAAVFVLGKKNNS